MLVRVGLCGGEFFVMLLCVCVSVWVCQRNSSKRVVKNNFIFGRGLPSNPRMKWFDFEKYCPGGKRVYIVCGWVGWQAVRAIWERHAVPLDTNMNSLWGVQKHHPIWPRVTLKGQVQDHLHFEGFYLVKETVRPYVTIYPNRKSYRPYAESDSTITFDLELPWMIKVKVSQNLKACIL